MAGEATAAGIGAASRRGVVTARCEAKRYVASQIVGQGYGLGWTRAAHRNRTECQTRRGDCKRNNSSSFSAYKLRAVASVVVKGDDTAQKARRVWHESDQQCATESRCDATGAVVAFGIVPAHGYPANRQRRRAVRVGEDHIEGGTGGPHGLIAKIQTATRKFDALSGSNDTAGEQPEKECDHHHPGFWAGGHGKKGGYA